jgi:two-component system, NtrC family, sensor kinase
MRHRVDPDRTAAPSAAGREPRDHTYYERMKRALRWKLLLVYVAPLLCLAVYFTLQARSLIRSGIEHHLCSVAENQRNTVDLFLMERGATLRGAFPSDLDLSTLNSAAMRKKLDRMHGEDNTLVDLGAFRPDGRLHAYAGPHPGLIGRDYSAEAWYRTLLNGERDPLVSDVFLGFRDRPHLIIATRRPTEEGIWTLRASIDPERFGRFVTSSHLTSDAETFVVNEAGRRQTLVGQAHSLEAPTPVPPRSADAQVTEIDSGGRRFIAAVAWLAQADWALVVRLPADRALEPARRVSIISAGFLLVALAAIVFIVLRTTDSIVGRLETSYGVRSSLQQQLFEAAKLASIGEMAAGVAHEINNPLAVIYEEAGLMEDLIDPELGEQPAPGELRERLGVIKGETMRCRDVTHKLLAFSRQHDPSPEPTNVNERIMKVVDARGTALSLSNIEVIADLDREVPAALVNPNHLHQVLLNLVNNARDAMADGGVLTLRTRSSDRSVRIDVEDTGLGMAPELLGQVFFPFFTTKTVGKGTGLGLSISYGIVKSSGGRIEVESELGAGTTFSVFLPIAGVAPSKDGADLMARE